MPYTNYYKNSGLLHSCFTPIMATRIDMLIFGVNEQELTQCQDDIYEEVSRLEKMLNVFDAESTVAQINANAFMTPVKITKELFDIFSEAIDFARKTQGFFDITLSDIGAISLDPDEATVRFEREDVRVDFGGYAKGLALRRIKSILESYGVERCLVNFGGSSILALGTHPHGEYWPVGIDNHRDKTEVIDVLKLVNSAASISGNSERNEGHIFNPVTRNYVESNRITAVVAEDPLVAEVLSTVLMIVEDELGDEICENFNVFEKHIYSYDDE